MDVQAELRITSDDAVRDLSSLLTWLQSQRELQGLVRTVRRPPSTGELGGAVELLTVALGSGGVGVVLTRALTVWLTNRKADVNVTVTTEAGTVTLEAKRVDDALPLLQEVLKHENSKKDEA
ncbi:hypothetical protein ABGB14_09370 [Nonomuraea sp. B10E15]|uniref:effector-associated constant component EACC1 n=1 Tax=Nonomuraea sp. B10E15 TaxID=3153560 RepID=UPI00325F4616